MTTTILSDTHSTDLLGFARYVAPLAQILREPQTATPLTVGIFGTWGTGKSTLLNMLDAELARSGEPEFLRVRFNAWLHRREQNMLVPLLHALRDTLELDAKHRFAESAKKIASVLARLGLGLILKTFTADAVSLEKLEALEAQYEKTKGHLDSDIRNLRTTLQGEMTKLAKDNVRVVVFIDDLDRCEPSDIIDLLEAIKLFLDLDNVFIILAVDKEIIDRGVEIRYGKFRFSANRKAAIGAEYLEKMVQLPLHLYPLHTSAVRDFVRAMEPGAPIASHIDFLAKVCAPNPRKIKRILNILALTVLTHAEIANLPTMLRLIVLQVQYPRLYADVVASAELLRGLEQAFASKAPLGAGDLSWAGTRRNALLEAIQDHWRPQDPHLTALFENAGWAELGQDALALNLSLLGR